MQIGGHSHDLAFKTCAVLLRTGACLSPSKARQDPTALQAAGQQTHFMIIAKDAHSTQKSLGGDKFALSWQHTSSGTCSTG